jgi:hypothetical protein
MHGLLPTKTSLIPIQFSGNSPSLRSIGSHVSLMGFVYVLSHLILVAVILSIVSLSLITRLHLISISSNLIDCVSLSMDNPFASEGPDWAD